RTFRRWRDRHGELQAAMPGEVAEVAVARDQLDIIVDAGLRDQRVGCLCLEIMPLHEAARMPGARPVAVMQVEGCEFRQEVVEGLSGKRIAQDFRNHHRRQRQLATLDSGGDAIDVFSGLTLEESRQGTRVAGDHSRSYLSSSRLMANLTLPRSLRRSCCAFIWAS